MGCLIPPPLPAEAAISKKQIAMAMMVHHLEKMAMTVHLVKMLCYPQKVCGYAYFTCVYTSLYTFNLTFNILCCVDSLRIAGYVYSFGHHDGM